MSQPTSNQASAMSASELARAEREASRHITLHTFGWLFAVAWLMFVVGLFLPHGGGVAGWQVVTLQSNDLGLRTGIAETAFVMLGTVGLALFGGLTLATKRTAFANAAWLFMGMALMASLLGMWMRLQDHEVLGGPGLGLGFVLEVAAIVLAVFSLSFMILRRSDRQKELAQLRAAHDNLDEVGYAQRAALVSQQRNTAETNPLLVDDRRKQAQARHKKNQV
ncbi:hypothetical protein P4N68_03135 [Corynebacterium felinum]|uniref:DUF4345 domain-containing protein n=1 Tax=Corynebacterium felinum TaxID=131318 RepID=A0ABU2BBB7_9CORY|nr:hypothetical protein [Corynebacterium felinum]MDF5820078.1 hypothetical protein [Corynebacterium felinum]MDR7355893.1 hypothetical protein [Corynebacterium felinum]WJY95236.1 hypothetical protein CFELI_08150 [Corynebacterium felinum]